MTAGMMIWLVMLPFAAATYALRVGFLLSGGAGRPAGWQRWLRFVPPAVLSALVALALFGSGSPFSPATLSQVLAAALAALVAWRFRNVLLTVATGMAAFWIVQALL
ncbi:MAG TPA: AzlD domain-containing protein [Ktedonobacterales bacterium]|nr:AzlD domain-containing protein [Ktedonobacterales bacterium]